MFGAVQMGSFATFTMHSRPGTSSFSFWSFQKIFLISLLQALGVDIFAKGLPVLVSHGYKCLNVEMEFVLTRSVRVCTMLASVLLHVKSELQFDMQLIEHPYILLQKFNP
jgi:hypothetical protein